MSHGTSVALLSTNQSVSSFLLTCMASIVLHWRSLSVQTVLPSVNVSNNSWKMTLIHTCCTKLTKQWICLCCLCFWFRNWSMHTNRTLFSLSSSFSSASLSLSTPSSLQISSAANLSGSTWISFGIRFGRWGKKCQTVSTVCEFQSPLRQRQQFMGSLTR